MWVLVAATAVVAIGYGLIAPVLPIYAKSFDVGVTAAGVIVSIFALFRLLFAPVSGTLVTRLGERSTYMLGLFIVAISSVATAFAGDYVHLLIYRGLGGIGSVFFTVSAAALLVRLSPPNLRGRVSSAYAGAFLIGNLVGPVLGGLLARWGIRLPFIVYAVALFVAIAVVWFKLPTTMVQPVVGAPKLPPMALGQAWAMPTFRAAVASNFANGWANFGVRVAMVPLLVAAAISTQEWVAGLVLATFAAGNAIAISFSGRLADSRGRRPLMLAGLVTAGLGTIALGYVTSLSIMVGLTLVAGLGAGLMGPAQQASIADVIGLKRSSGQVLAVFTMVSDLGAIIAPVATGAIIDHLGYGLGFAVAGSLLLLAAIPWVFVRDIPRE